MDNEESLVCSPPNDTRESTSNASTSVTIDRILGESTPQASLLASSNCSSRGTSSCTVSSGTMDDLSGLPEAVADLTMSHCVDEAVKTRHNQTKGSRRKKGRSLYGVSPHCKFGPKGFLEDSTAAFLKIPDPSSQKLSWLKTPVSVLVIKKPHDATVTSAFRDLVIWLIQEKGLMVYVEESVVRDDALSRDPHFLSVQDSLHKFKEGVDELDDKVDFITCLGGDGTLIYASSLFQQSVPPVIAFNMGSLGFLTPFPFCSFKERINHVLKGQAPLLLRYRLKCVIQSHREGSSNTDTSSAAQSLRQPDSSDSLHSLHPHILVLNEVVIDRGPSSYLCNLDLYIEGHLVTSVLGDGLIISSPTGSTAYSVAAGASMIHPNVPCILLTPICPHSLSFRPIVLPAGVEVKVTLSPEARGTAMVSFDGRNRQQMHQGVSLRVSTASYPVPSICAQGQIEDWFSGLADCLHWNVRKTQKPLTSSLSLTSLESVDLENFGK